MGTIKGPHDHERFRLDMQAAGREVEEYHGRFGWRGPAVRAEDQDDYHDIIRATRVRLQTDSMGRGLIVYPVARPPEG